MLHLNNGSDYGPLGTNAFMKPHLSLKFLLAPKNLSKFCTVIWENTYNTYIYLWNRDKILKSCLTLIKTAGAHLLNQMVFNTCTIFPTIPCSSKKKVYKGYKNVSTDRQGDSSNIHVSPLKPHLQGYNK